MVLASVGVLSILVAEFVYVAQVNQRMAYDGIDQLKAHYLAKSGFKLSLLRLKAYKQLKDFVQSQGLGALVPKSLLDQVWSFPFTYPIPSTIPGLTMTQKDAIEKFQKGSSIDGRFTTIIESESSRFNLNSLVMNTPKADASPTPNPTPDGQGGGAPGPNPTPTASAFDAEAARKTLTELVVSLFQNKMKGDEEFAEEYRDLIVTDLSDAIIAWADPNYVSQNQRLDRDFPWKKAPYYSVTELHLLPGMDDALYGVLAPAFTVSPTAGVNVNTVQKEMLHALFPQFTDEETAKFFTDRDPSPEGPGKPFTDVDSFFKWITDNVSAIRGNETEMKKEREALEKRGVRFVVDETEFVIRVTASVNQASKTLEAWVALGGASPSSSEGSGSGATPTPTPEAGAEPGPTPTPKPGEDSTSSSGIQLRFMRFL